MKISITDVLLAIIVALTVFAIFFAGHTFGASNSAGTQYVTAKVAEQNLAVATDTAFAYLNNDGTDRVIEGFQMFGQNGAATTSTYGIKCATSTTATGFAANTNYIVNQNLGQTVQNGSLIFGSTTGQNNPLYVSSSSPGLTGTTSASSLPLSSNAWARVWPAGTYLVCKFTASGSNNSLNTLDAATTGYIAFPYRAQ